MNGTGKSKFQRILSLFLALVMVVGMMPANVIGTAFAVESDPLLEGGNTLTYAEADALLQKASGMSLAQIALDYGYLDYDTIDMCGGNSHLQGICVDDKLEYMYFSYTSSLAKLDMKTGKVVASVGGFGQGSFGTAGGAHLGCLAYYDGWVYGSLEYKEPGAKFYIAAFDTSKLTTTGMDIKAMDEGVNGILLKEPTADFRDPMHFVGDSSLDANGFATNEANNGHRFACSGIDGVTFGTMPGDDSGTLYLIVAYGVYAFTGSTRLDNQYNVLQFYKVSDFWNGSAPVGTWNYRFTYERGLSSDIAAGEELAAAETLYVYTGNTSYGSQNIEFEEDTGDIVLYTYGNTDGMGSSMYVVDGSKAPVTKELQVGQYSTDATALAFAANYQEADGSYPQVKHAVLKCICGGTHNNTGTYASGVSKADYPICSAGNPASSTTGIAHIGNDGTDTDYFYIANGSTTAGLYKRVTNANGSYTFTKVTAAEADAPIVHWTMDAADVNGDGTIVDRGTGYSSYYENVTSVAGVDGKAGGALYFDGTADSGDWSRVWLGEDGITGINALIGQKATIAFWMKPDSTKTNNGLAYSGAWSPVVGLYGTNNGQYRMVAEYRDDAMVYCATTSDGDRRLYARVNGGNSGTYKSLNDEWYLVVMTYDETQTEALNKTSFVRRIYVGQPGGTMVESTPEKGRWITATGVLNNLGYLEVGGQAYKAWTDTNVRGRYVGAIDDLKVYNRYFTLAQAQQLLNAGVSTSSEVALDENQVTVSVGSGLDVTVGTQNAGKLQSVTGLSSSQFAQSGSTITLEHTALADLGVGSHSITLEFDNGAATLGVTVVDTRTYFAGDLSFEKAAPADVTFQTKASFTSAPVSVKAAGITEADYTISGNEITISQAYLMKQQPGAVAVTVTASNGVSQVAYVHVTNEAPTGTSTEPYPVLYYKMDAADQADGTIKDYSGHGIDAQYEGLTESKTGGDSLFFDAYKETNISRMYLDEVGMDYLKSVLDKDVSFSFWYKGEGRIGSNHMPVIGLYASDDRPLVESKFSDTGGERQGSTGDPVLAIVTQPAGNITAGAGEYQDDTKLTANNTLKSWHHVVMTYDGTTGGVAIYMDGALMHEDTAVANQLASVAALEIGGMVNPNYYNVGTINDMRAGATRGRLEGSLDEIKVYDVVLEQDNVTALYDMGRTSDLPVDTTGAVYGVTDGDGEAQLASGETVTVTALVDGKQVPVVGATVSDAYAVALPASSVDELITVTISGAADGTSVTLTDGDGADRGAQTTVSEAAFFGADKTALEAAILATDELVAETYTDASWSNLLDKLTAAEEVMADVEATQAEVDAATKALNTAVVNLVKKELNVYFNLAATDAYYYKTVDTVVSGSEYTLPAAALNPIRDGYQFTGWLVNGNVYTATETIPADVLEAAGYVLVAQWTKSEITVTVTNNAEATYTGTAAPYAVGDVYELVLTLAEGYDPASVVVTVNGVYASAANVAAQDDGTTVMTYQITLKEDTAIVIQEAAKLSYPIILPQGAGFVAAFTDPASTSLQQTLEYGETYSFTVTPNGGYELKSITINGVAQTIADARAQVAVEAVVVDGPQVIEVVTDKIPTRTVNFTVENEPASYAIVSVQDGSAVAEPEVAPARDGYTFLGWYTADGALYDFTAEVTADMILYGKFEANRYEVSYDGNGVTLGAAYDAVEYTYGATVTTLEAPEAREGYTFLGWSVNKDATVAAYEPGDQFTMPAQAVTLYAIWAPNTYTVTLPTGVGYSVVTSQSNIVGHGADFAFDVVVAPEYAENAPTVKVFKTNDTAATTLTAAATVENDDGSVTYSYVIENIVEDKSVTVSVAHNRTYVVTFEVLDEAWMTQMVEYGGYASMPQPPVIEGYTFEGWFTDETYATAYDFTAAITGNVTVYANMVAIEPIVSLPADGADSDWTVDFVPVATDVDADNLKVSYNGSAVIAVTVNEGFDASAIQVGANGYALVASSIENGADNSTVYTYELHNIKEDQQISVSGIVRKTVTITYHDNGGVGGPTQQVLPYYVASRTDNGNLTEAIPTMIGYEFVEWNTAADGTGTAYAAGAANDFTADTVLYAQWDAKDVVVTLAVTDAIDDTAAALSEYEGETVTLTAAVTGVTSGSVEFFKNGVSLGTAEIAGGKASMTVKTSDWTETIEDVYTAEFLPDEGAGYEAPEASNEVAVDVKSETIRWEAASELMITGTLDADGSMIAGETYTLTIPAVVPVEADVDAAYNVIWQKKNAAQDWVTVATAGDEYIVTSYEEGDQYRALVLPAVPFYTAASYDADGNVSGYKAAYLTTDPTDPVVVKETATVLAISGTNDVDVSGTAALAEYEGEEITLTATVTADGAVVSNQGYVKFEILDAEGNVVAAIDNVAVENNGNAAAVYTMPAYVNEAAKNTYTVNAYFLGTEAYEASSDVVDADTAAHEVTVRSKAIAWSDAEKALTAEINGTVLDATNAEGYDTMYADNTYVLTLPDEVLEQMMDDEITDVALSVGTHYEIEWFEVAADGVVTSLGESQNNTFTVTPATAGVTYYAHVIPMESAIYDHAYENDAEASYLTVELGLVSKLAPTVTDLEITKYFEKDEAESPDYTEYEKESVTLTATVVEGSIDPFGEATDTVVKTGSVSFYYMVNGGEAVKIATVAVENGQAVTDYEMPVYALGEENVVRFFAIYEDVANVYDMSSSANDVTDYTAVAETDVEDDEAVEILTAAISWALTKNGDVYEVAENGSKITITDKAGAEVEEMIADNYYTLTLPAIYAADDAADVADGTAASAEALKVGRDYTVAWEYYVVETNSWTAYGQPTATSNSVEITPEYSQYVFRAVITPVYDNDNLTGYKTAVEYAGQYNGEALTTIYQVLYTAPTEPTIRQDTTTELAILYADPEAADVMINGKTDVFEQVHLAQFEGQTVTLRATVTDASDALVQTGIVYFYRADGTKLNDTPVAVADGVAEFEVTIADYDTAKDALANADAFYAVYQENATYNTSESRVDGEPDQWKHTVYIKSTEIMTPVITSKLPNEAGEDETTYTADLSGLQSGVEHEFTLRTDVSVEDWSVVALDGRAVKASNYEIHWLETIGDNEENVAVKDLETFRTTTTKEGDMYRVWLEPKNDMTAGAHSKYAIIAQKQKANVTVTTSDEIAATAEKDVYQLNDITLTAAVTAYEADATMQPTGNVTFYYSVDGTVWTEIETATLALNTVSGQMEASIVTDVLPVDENGKTKEEVTITAIYLGDTSFLPSGEYVDSAVVDAADVTVTDAVVTVYSSVVHRSTKENVAYTPTAEPKAEDGIMIYADGFVVLANESNVPLHITDVYTLDYATNADDVAKLVYGTDYTVKWQICRNYAAGTDAWVDLADGTNVYTIDVEQGAAYRAVVTVRDTAPVKGSFTEVEQDDADILDGDKVYYSNILVATNGQADLTVSVTTSEQGDGMEGIVEGETATIHTYVSGATETTPISHMTVTITDKDGNEVLKDERDNVNGYTSIDWDTTDVTPGYYTLTVVAESSNGYDPQTTVRTLIVRDDNYVLTVTDNAKVYNGKAQGIDWTLTGVDIEDTLAQASAYVTYTQDGKLVEPTQAGTYEYTLVLPESAYWTEHSVTGTFTIEQRKVSVVDLTAQVKVYDGANAANLQEIVLNDAVTAQATTGLPTGDTGVINGDSIYAVGTGYTKTAAAGKAVLAVKDVVLKGDDAANYVLADSSYTESFNIQRNQLKGDVADATYAYTGENITLPAEDVYLIDQQGKEVTDYTVTYYYHNGEGVEKVAAMNQLGKYTVIVGKDANYKGGASQIVYVAKTAVDAAPVKTAVSSVISITNTAQLYGESTGVTVTATSGTVSVEYYYGGAWNAAAPTDAGRYLVKATASTGDVAYGVYSIAKAWPELKLSATDTVYDSARYDGTVYGSYNGEAMPADAYATYVGSFLQDVAYEAPTEAGSYAVTTHVLETANYTAHEVTANFVIKQADLTITADSLQRHLYGEYYDMVATYTGLATDGVAPDTSLRDVQIAPEFIYDNHRNFAESHVGKYVVTPVSALARNYNVTYVAGEFSVTEMDPQPQLAIHGAPQNGTGAGYIAYYGDVIQLYAYGNTNGITNKSSVLKWSVTGPATIDQSGTLEITGIGEVVVTLTRGTGSQTISTSITIDARKQEVKVIVPDVDKVYNGSEQSYDAAAYAVNSLYSTVVSDAEVVKANTKRTDIGSQIVTGKVNDSVAYYQSETYGGLFTINDKDVKVLPVDATTVYGSVVSGLTYTEQDTVSGIPALTADGKAVSVADVYNNLDVALVYEILVAGREEMNYNVSYVTRPAAEAGDVTVTDLALTVTTGSVEDSVGMTGGSVNPAGDYPANGAEVNPDVFELNGLRMYGEPNQVMDYVLETLIAGDSMADLNALVDWLVSYDKLINADANVEYPDKTTVITGRTAPYYIETAIDMVNYAETVVKGTQNIFQRPITLAMPEDDTTIDVHFGITQAEFEEAILTQLIVGKYNGEGGLAELLNHTVLDLDLQFEYVDKATGAAAAFPLQTNKTYIVKVTVGNLNYWLADSPFELEVTVLPYMYEAVINSFTANYAKVTLYKVTEDGSRTAAWLPNGDQVWCEIYEKLPEGAEYADYAKTEKVVDKTMTKGSNTGEYYVYYNRLTGNFRMYATTHSTGYVIIHK